jgi:hypothetical protein
MLAVCTVLVDRFCRNASPTLAKFAVLMLTAFDDSVMVIEIRPASAIEAVTPPLLTELAKKPLETRYETL